MVGRFLHGRRYGLMFLAGVLILHSLAGQPEPAGNVPFIAVDQIGYLSEMKKVAVIGDPQEGYNAHLSYTPSQSLKLIRVSDQKHVANLKAVLWDEGRVDPLSGNKVWHVDFSSYKKSGEFYIDDEQKGVRSYSFKIGAKEEYLSLLKQALKVLYYQRCGVNKVGLICDHRCHIQDESCASLYGEAKVRDLSGGWHDAGDYNKYVCYAYPTVHHLLNMYALKPSFWNDFELDIPESGNLTPDLLDELKWELDWLLKMQNEDGSFLHLVGSDIEGGRYYGQHTGKPASEDRAKRYYEKASGQASCAALSMLSHAAFVYREAPGFQEYSQLLYEAAKRAWVWCSENPEKWEDAPLNSAKISSSNGFLNYYGEEEEACFEGACFLHLLSSDQPYLDYLLSNYEAITNITPTMLAYANAPAVQETKIARKLVQAFSNNRLYKTAQNPYRDPKSSSAWWGHNKDISNDSFSFYLMAPRVSEVNRLECLDSLCGGVNYLHGCNPLGIAYLTNIEQLGGDRYLTRFYNGDSQLSNSPVPVNLAGGPNAGFSGQASPPRNQPPQKAFDVTLKATPVYEYAEGQLQLQSSYASALFAVLDAYGCFNRR